MRNACCPVCLQATDLLLELRFSTKMRLPTEAQIRHCAIDNFLFLASGSQHDYDEYYAGVKNDSYHQEISGGSLRSPISQVQSKCLLSALGDFFNGPKKVLDFGCGEASLLVELADFFPLSTFVGYDIGPAAGIAASKAQQLNLSNLLIRDFEGSRSHGPYDLVIASHLMEHMVEFDLLGLLAGSLGEQGLLYIEVPNPLQYAKHDRLEFLYYFDRLHVNHFTPQSLTRLAAGYGLGYITHFEFAFPYRDGGQYPAFGILFRKGGKTTEPQSPSVKEEAGRYIEQERLRAKALSATLSTFDGVLVWGAGDNFYRSIANGGPLENLQQMIILDRQTREVKIKNGVYKTMNPEMGIREYPWPVVVTISEGRKDIHRKINEIDAARRVVFV